MRSCTESHGSLSFLLCSLAGMLYEGKHAHSKLLLLICLSIFYLIATISVSYFFFSWFSSSLLSVLCQYLLNLFYYSHCENIFQVGCKKNRPINEEIFFPLKDSPLFLWTG